MDCYCYYDYDCYFYFYYINYYCITLFGVLNPTRGGEDGDIISISFIFVLEYSWITEMFLWASAIMDTLNFREY